MPVTKIIYPPLAAAVVFYSPSKFVAERLFKAVGLDEIAQQKSAGTA
jgi:hypothetical protein